MSARAPLAAALLLVACTPGDTGTPLPTPIADVTAAPTEREPTVLRVEWTTLEDTPSWVEYGETEALGLATAPDEGGTDHGALLFGMPAATDVHFRVHTAADRGEAEVAATGNLPPEVPELALTVEGATWPGWIALPGAGEWKGVIVVDPQGRVVWFHADAREGTTLIRARPSHDRQWIYYNVVANTEETTGEIVKVSLDGARTETIRVPGQSHDFVELPDGTLEAIQVEHQDVDGVDVAGDRIYEIPPTGEGRVVWNAFDWIDPRATAPDRDPLTWTHANALDWDAEQDRLLLGLRNLETIVTIDRPTGEMLDAFGGEIDAGWTFVGLDRAFAYQHQFQRVGDRWLVFDNSTVDVRDSRVVEFEIDDDARTATVVWTWGQEPPVWTYALGDVERLDDGSTLVDWAVGGQIQQVDGDGTTTLWQIDAPMGFALGYMTRFTSWFAAE